MYQLKNLKYLVFFGYLLALVSVNLSPVQTEMRELSDKSLSGVAGQEGLKMVLEDFRVSGNQTLEIRSDEFSSDGSLLLSDLTLDDGLGGGVTTGSTGDPITFDIDGSNNGRWVIELPDNSANMDQNDITIDDAWIRDGGDRKKILDDIAITNAQYAGGTRFALGTVPGGGLQLGIGIVLNGDVELSAPDFGSSLELNQVGGFGNCNNGPTNFDIDSDCSGVLDWASLEQGRPLQLEMFNDGSNGQLSLQFITSGTVSAGQIVVENARFNNESYGEIWTNDLKIKGLKAKGPVDVNKSGHTGCQCTR